MRTSSEIFTELRGLMAELEAALKAEGKGTDEELSPLLKAALEKPQGAYNELVSGQALAPLQVPMPERQSSPKPRSSEMEPKWLREQRQEKPERLKDYTPADDPDWDNSVFMGTGDRRVD